MSNIKKPKPNIVITIRECMCCRNEFESEGKFNRLCEACKNGNAGVNLDYCISIPPWTGRHFNNRENSYENENDWN